MKVVKWGNSLAIRLPAALVKELGLSAGDEIEVTISADRKVRFDASREERRAAAIAYMKASNWKLPEGWKPDRL